MLLVGLRGCAGFKVSLLLLPVLLTGLVAS